MNVAAALSAREGSTAHVRGARTHPARRAFTVIVTAGLLGLAAYHLLLTASTVVAFHLRYPFMDQWRTLLNYLTTPFPASVLALENGHRPVLPGLVRLAEITWFDGMPGLETATAWLAAAIVWLALAARVLRGLRGRPVDVAAGVCAISCLVFWNVSARMFIHPFEAVHVFYVLLFVVLALAAVAEPAPRSTGAWLLALLACAGATFSFGSGFASFAAVVAVALARRERPRVYALILTASVATFAVYFLALPGAEGVRGSIAEAPFGTRALLWLARVGAVAVELVRPYTDAPDVHTAVALAAGSVVLAAAASSVAVQAVRGRPWGTLALAAIGLLAFGLAANGLVVLSRTEFFRQHPGELFADRYVVWSATCWTAVAMLVLGTGRAGRGETRWSVAIATAAVAALGIAPALEANGWSAEVRRHSELNAAGLRAGYVSEDDRLALVGEPAPTMHQAIAQLRAHHLAMFRDRAAVHMGQQLALAAPGLTVPIRVEAAPATYAGAPWTLLSGRLPHDVTSHAGGATLWVADATGNVIGAAAFTYAPRRRVNALRIGVAVPAGFQGYAIAHAAPALLVAVGADAVPRALARLTPLK